LRVRQGSQNLEESLLNSFRKANGIFAGCAESSSSHNLFTPKETKAKPVQILMRFQKTMRFPENISSRTRKKKGKKKMEVIFLLFLLQMSTGISFTKPDLVEWFSTYYFN
jgi:hypothetical protein